MGEQPTRPEDRPTANELRYGVGIDSVAAVPPMRLPRFVPDRRSGTLICRHCSRGDRLGVRIGFDGRPLR